MTMRTITIVNAVAILFILAVALCLSTKAKAFDELEYDYWRSRATDRSHCAQWGIDSACAYKSPNRIRRAQIRAWRRHQDDLHAYRDYKRDHRYYEPEIRRARVWREEAIEYREDRIKCEDRLRVVGDQYASEKGAQEEADKAWMQTARWQYGERFMARDHAQEAEYECGRSSVGSVVGQVFYRCRLTARPCSAPKVRSGH